MSYAGRKVVVAGARVAGAACARVLLELGAQVTVVDRTASASTGELAGAGATIVIADEPSPDLFDGVSDLVVSPGFAPHHPLVVAASAKGLDIYCEPELAWRLRRPDAAPWLAITGTNGKTTTTTMLTAILRAAGHRTAALGNIGEPLVSAVNDPSYAVLAVELSSFQLYWSSTLAPQVGALLNLAEDHLEWHGDLAAYTQSKTAIWRGARKGTLLSDSVEEGAPPSIAVGNLDDEVVARLLAGVPGRRVGFTLGEPKPGQLGVVDGMLVDFAFAAEPVELTEAAGIRPAGPHNVANALAAAALGRAYGAALGEAGGQRRAVPASAVRDGLAGYTPEPHRNEFVATVGGVSYVDDSKATNPHAAFASLTAYPRIVWLAGGQLKNVDVDDLVRGVGDRLVGVVLLGVDRARLAQALARHAPQVPVVDVASTDDRAMGEVVSAAARLAAPGDTVLLAPAAASLDMFASYGKRGDAFAAAVRKLT
jgi:UDP-N-acetylmuramoylalanine--D-glutamate ligase